MWEDSGGDKTQGAAKCDPKYTRWILHAILKIRSQRWRPSVDRICCEVLRYHPQAVEGEVRKQLELCVQDGKVHKVIHNGLPSYRDPGVFKSKDLLALIEIAISASTCKKGASFVSIEKYIKNLYPDEVGCDSEFRSQLAMALRTGVTSGRLVTDGLVYRIAESTDSPGKDQNCSPRIAKSKGPSPLKRKHIPRISERSAQLAKKKRKHVPRMSESSAPLAKKRKTIVNSSALYVRKGYQPVLGIAESSTLLAEKGEHSQRTGDCVTPVKKGKKYKKMDKKTLNAASTSEGLQTDRSKYTEWIVNAICKIRKIHHRPCEAGICRQVVKAHQNASIQEIKEHLDLCTQEGKILKVSFKGSTSYRIPDELIRDKACKKNFLQKLEAAITNLAEEGGSSLKSIKTYMGQSWNVSLLLAVAEEGVACGRLQKDGSLYRIAQNSHKPTCVGEKLGGNVGVVYKAQAERVETTLPATSISEESKMDIHHSATITQDLSHLELLIPSRCKYCRRYFASMSRYRIHKRRHERIIKTYWYRKSCKLCGRPAKSARKNKCHSNLCSSCHINSSQNSAKPYRATTGGTTTLGKECARCRKIFLNLDQLKGHMCKPCWPGQTGTNRVRCAKCGNPRLKHEICAQLCRPCARSLMAQGMTELELSHLEGKFHKCKICSRYFLDAEKLKEHEMIKHKKTCVACGNARKVRKYPLLCKPCGEAQEKHGLTPFEMTEHDMQVKVHKCQWCNETFPNLVKLKKHKVIRHEGRCTGCGGLGIMHEKHPLLCKPCGDSVTTIEITNQDREKKTCTCRCITCDKWFADSGVLIEHELIVHGRTVITCVVCGNQSTRHEKHPQICKQCHDSVTGGNITSKVVLAEKHPSDLQPNESVIWIPITKCVLCGQPTAKHKEHPHLCKKCNTSVSLMAAKHRQPQFQEIIACKWCGGRNSQHDEHPHFCKKCRELGITNQTLKQKICKTCNKWIDREKLTEHKLSKHGITCLVCGNRSIRHEKHPQICQKCYKSVAELGGTKTSKVVLAENRPNRPVLWIPLTKCVLCGQPTAKHKEHSHLCKNCNKTLMGAIKQPQNSTVQVTRVMNKPATVTVAMSASKGQAGNSNKPISLTVVRSASQEQARNSNAQMTCAVNKTVSLTDAKSASKGQAGHSNKPVSLPVAKLAYQGQAGNSNSRVTCTVNEPVSLTDAKSASQGQAQSSNSQVTFTVNKPVSLPVAKSAYQGQAGNSNAEVTCAVNKPVSLPVAKSACQGQAGNSNAQVTCAVNKPVSLAVVKSASQGQAGNLNAQVTCVMCRQQRAASGKQVCMSCNQSLIRLAFSVGETGTRLIKFCGRREGISGTSEKVNKGEINCDEMLSSMGEEKAHQKHDFIACKWCGKQSVKHDEPPRLCKKCNKSWSAAKSNIAGQESSKFVEKVMSNTKSSPQERSVFYKCWHCSKTFSQFDELMAHKTAVHQQVTIPALRIKTKSPQNQAVTNVIYGCNFCSKTFLQSEELAAHEMAEHKPETRRICKVTWQNHQKTSNTKSSLQEQAPVMHECNHCSKTFLQLDELTAHEMAEHKQETPHICKVISNTKSPENKAGGTKVCGNDKSTKNCKVCGCFTRKDEEHQDTCSSCNNNSDLLKKHRLILHRRGRCTRCRSLGAIMHEKHPRLCQPCGDSVKPSPVRITNKDLEKKMTKCKTCNQWFLNLEKLKEHQLSEHGTQCTYCEHKTPHIHKVHGDEDQITTKMRHEVQK